MFSREVFESYSDKETSTERSARSELEKTAKLCSQYDDKQVNSKNVLNKGLDVQKLPPDHENEPLNETYCRRNIGHMSHIKTTSIGQT